MKLPFGRQLNSGSCSYVTRNTANPQQFISKTPCCIVIETGRLVSRAHQSHIYSLIGLLSRSSMSALRIPVSCLILSLSSSILNSSFTASLSSSLFLAPLRSSSLASLSAFSRLSSSLSRWIHFCCSGSATPAPPLDVFEGGAGKLPFGGA
jgi:hypothetical protein